MVIATKRRQIPAATDAERERFYEPVGRVFRRLFAEEGKAARDAYRRTGLLSSAERAIRERLPRLREALAILYDRMIVYFGRRTRRDLDGGEYSPEGLQLWIDETAAARAALIIGTSVIAVQQVVGQAIVAGASIAAIAYAIEMLYRRRAPKRSRALQATEVSAAANAAAVDAAKQSGNVSQKQWISKEDERVRRSHVRAHGQTVGVNEDFIVGKWPGAYPGDPRLPAHETINCRCELRLLT